MAITQHPYYPKEKCQWVHVCEEKFCTWRVATKTPSPVPHKCPWLGGPTTLGWSIVVTLLETMWHRLDSMMDELTLFQQDHPAPRSTDDETYLYGLKQKARGMAEIIGLFMTPYYRDANEVAAEAQRRANARATQDKEYETLGLGHLRLAPPPGSDMEKYKRQPAGKKPPPVPAIATLSDADKSGIINASAMFPVEELAKVYKVPESTVKAVLHQHKLEQEANAG